MGTMSAVSGTRLRMWGALAAMIAYIAVLCHSAEDMEMPPVPDNSVAAEMKKMDENGDGIATFEELKHHIKQSYYTDAYKQEIERNNAQHHDKDPEKFDAQIHKD